MPKRLRMSLSRSSRCIERLFGIARLTAVSVSLLVSLFATAANPPCGEKWVKTPPAFLTGVTENAQDSARVATWRIEKDDPIPPLAITGRQPASPQGEKNALVTEKFHTPLQSGERRFIARNSIVQLWEATFDPSKPDVLYPVKILSVETSEKYKRVFGTNDELAGKGDKGFIAGRSLRAISGKDRFILKEDAVMLAAKNGLSRAWNAGTILKPILKNTLTQKPGELPQYLALVCRSPDGKNERLHSYVFEAFDPDREQEAEHVLIDFASACPKIEPIDNQTLGELARIRGYLERVYGNRAPRRLDELSYNEFGLVKLPMRATSPEANITGVAFDGSFVHYQGDDPIGSDIWAHPDTICAFTAFASRWQAECAKNGGSTRDCTVQVGDLAFISPAIRTGSQTPKAPHGIDPLGHQLHSSGKCIDIRPLRKDGKWVATRLGGKQTPPGYDRERTRAFIELARQMGAGPIYFNDRALAEPAPAGKTYGCDLSGLDPDMHRGTQTCEGHDDHIHLCFDAAKNPKAKGCEP